MVNYLYDLDYIEQNHEAYAQQHAIVAASAISRMVRAPPRDIVPVSGSFDCHSGLPRSGEVRNP